jgi:hypothetical protein
MSAINDYLLPSFECGDESNQIMEEEGIRVAVIYLIFCKLGE